MKISRVIVLGLTLALFLLACNAPPPQIVAATMGTRVQAGKIANPTTTFKPGDHALYLVVDAQNVLDGTTLGAKWYALDAGDLKNKLLLEHEVQLDPLNTSGEFVLTSTGDVPPGKYKVDIFFNGKFDRSVEFEVKA